MRALLVALLFLVAGCASQSDDPEKGSGGGTGDVEILHIHGIALDPTDASILYVATHSGLLRLDDDGDWSYVGTTRDDFMGFTAHPTDPKTFFASGHPRAGGNFGVIRSTDGGATWTKVGADGVDFHAMAVSAADPQRLYGFWRGSIQRSDDAGATWANAGAIGASAIATHPTERDTAYVATTRSLHRSTDAGKTWTEVAGAGPALGVLVDQAEPSTIYVGTQQGIRKTTDEGRTWSDLTLPQAGTFAAFATHRATPGLVYAASYQNGIYRSTDGGATWTIVLEPTS